MDVPSDGLAEGTPLAQSAAALADVGAERVGRYLAAAHAPATLRGYDGDWAHFASWCFHHGRQPLPAAPETVALYLTALADGQPDSDPPESARKPATIARRAAAIAHVHGEAGHLSPTDHEGVRRTLRGIRRMAARSGVRTAKARAVDTDEIRLLVEDLPTDTLAGRRDRAAVLLGYALALRASDLVTLDVGDLQPHPRGLRVHLAYSKTDQDGAGVELPLAYGKRTATCPVRAVQAWTTAAGLVDGPLLRSVDRAGRIGTGRMATSSIYRLLRRAGGQAGVDLNRLSPHSLRRGHITTAASAGASEREIARTSRHASMVVLRGYIDEADAFRDPSSGHLGL